MNTASRTLDRSSSVLCVIDYQDRLFAAMDETHRATALQNVRLLLEAARILPLPVIATEQYPKGLGRTLPEITEVYPTLKAIEKIEFPCTANESFSHVITTLKRPAVILAGMETHICVYQTALGLIGKGFLVHVVADACLSRKKLNWKLGLAQCEKAGANITTAESVVFELLGKAGSDEFKAISKLVR